MSFASLPGKIFLVTLSPPQKTISRVYFCNSLGFHICLGAHKLLYVFSKTSQKKRTASVQSMCNQDALAPLSQMILHLISGPLFCFLFYLSLFSHEVRMRKIWVSGNFISAQKSQFCSVMPFLEYLDKWSLNIILPTPFSAELDKLESDWNLTWFHYRGRGGWLSTKSDFVPGGFNNRTFFIRLRNWIFNINPVTEDFFDPIHEKDRWRKFQ